jgi:cytochrome P450
MHALYNSLAGAVMMETLRLTPASTRVPKVATRDEDQAVTLEEEGGREVIIPAGALIHLNTIGAQRNPAYYPHKASKRTRKGDDMDDFVPERWVLDSGYNADSKFPTVATASTRREEVQSTPAIDGDGDGDGVSNPSFSKKSALFHPRRGAFLAFSDGSRSCPGRRFAEIEVTAVMAVIFQSYTVELDVREWASDEEVRGMGREEKRAVYEKATQRVRALVEGAKVRVLLEIVGGKVPVRFVKRRGELFASVRD